MTATTMTAPSEISYQTWRMLEQFVYREAAMLDRRQLDGWVELFSDDAIYWVPNVGGEGSPLGESAPIIYDDKRGIKIRAMRLQHPAALTQRPTPATRRFISNVQVEQSGQDEWRVCSNQLVCWMRGEVETQYAGAMEHVVRAVEGELRIVRKKVTLLTSAVALSQIPVL